MKKIFLLLVSLVITSCSSHTLDSVMDLIADPKEARAEFKTTKDLCLKASGSFDDNTNLCSCSQAVPFVGDENNLCHVNAVAQSFSTQDRQHELQVIDEAGLSNLELDKFIKQTTMPSAFKSKIYIFRSLAQYTSKNSKDNLHYYNTNFFQGSTSTEIQIYFAPVATPNLRPIGEPLASALPSILNKSWDTNPIAEVKLFNGDSCLNGCFVTSIQSDTKDYQFVRIQTYKGGNRLFDTYRVVNKFDNHLEVVMVMFNGKLSHYYKSIGKGYFKVYTNTGEILNYAASIKEI